MMEETKYYRELLERLFDAVNRSVLPFGVWPAIDVEEELLEEIEDALSRD